MDNTGRLSWQFANNQQNLGARLFVLVSRVTQLRVQHPSSFELGRTSAVTPTTGPRFPCAQDRDIQLGQVWGLSIYRCLKPA